MRANVCTHAFEGASETTMIGRRIYNKAYARTFARIYAHAGTHARSHARTHTLIRFNISGNLESRKFRTTSHAKHYFWVLTS